MGIPFSYNVRNLAVRRSRTLLTALAMTLALVIFVVVSALVEGLNVSLHETGDSRNVLVLSKGASSEMESMLDRDTCNAVKALGKVERDPSGQPLASLELVSVINISESEEGKGTNVTVRGLSEDGVQMRGAQLVEGRWFSGGLREVVVGKMLASRLKLRTSGFVNLGGSQWLVTGIAANRNSAYGSEIWTDLNQLDSVLSRGELLSSVLLKTSSPQDAKALVVELNASHFRVSAQTESDYFASQMSAGIPIQVAGLFMAYILAIGAALITMMTMFANVAERRSEIAVLRVLGFSRSNVLTSFLFESLLIATLAMLVAALFTFPLNWFQAGIGNFSTMSELEVHFHVGAAVLLRSFLFTVVVALCGAVIPACSASFNSIVLALRK